MHYPYWVIFPQGIQLFESEESLQKDSWYSSSSMVQCRTLKEAREVKNKLQGAFIEKVVWSRKEGKRVTEWVETSDEDFELTEKALWCKYSILPTIKRIIPYAEHFEREKWMKVLLGN